MQRRTQLLVTFSFLIILIIGLYLGTDWFSKVTGYFTGEDEKTKLAQCLDDGGAEFYGTEYCAECEKQEELFGPSFKIINKVDCGRDKSLCPNIRSIPAWYINKKIYYDFKTIKELKDISGCIDR